MDNVDRLSRKFETARKFVPAPVVETNTDAKIGIIGYGTSHWAITESRDQLREETSVKTSYLRMRAYPFNDDWSKFIDAHERIYIVEQNRDAQLAMLMRLELSPERVAKLRSVLHYNGLPIDARSVSDDILAQEGFEVARKDHRLALGRRRIDRWRIHGDSNKGQSHRARACRSTRAARRRCAPDAATTRSPSASSTRFTRWASIPSRS